MEIRERCIQVRKDNNLTQQSFADKIGVSVGVISNIELSRAPVTNVVCNAICYKFGIREEWLLHGTGPMYQEDNLVEALAARRNMDSVQRSILSAAASLTPEEAQLLCQVAQRISDGVLDSEPLPTLTAADLPPVLSPEDLNQKKLG